MERLLLELARHDVTENPVKSWLMLQETTDLIDHLLERTFASTALTYERFRILGTVILFEGRGTQADIAHRLLRRPHTVSKVVLKMKQSGLISEQRDPKDGRRVLLRATEEGKNLYWDAMNHYLNHFVHPTFSLMSADRQELLHELLEELKANTLASELMTDLRYDQ